MNRYYPHSGYYDPPYHHYEYLHHHPNILYYNPYPSFRNPLQTDPAMFMDSAQKTQLLMKDASNILGKLANSKPFSSEIIDAAKNSQKDRVVELINSTGIKNFPQVSYTPNGLTLTFINEDNNIDCCHLILKVRWATP